MLIIAYLTELQEDNEAGTVSSPRRTNDGFDKERDR